MVKNKASGPKSKNNSNKSVITTNTSKTAKLKWYVWVIFGLIIVILNIMAYKNVVTRRDVALLDSAEQKMRQLDLPGGKEGEIERYCSERSVKFGSAGKPTCGVTIKVAFSNPVNITELHQELNKRQVGMQVDNENVSFKYYSLSNLQTDLDCNLSLDNNDANTTNSAYIYCQKEFQTKVYPIRD